MEMAATTTERKRPRDSSSRMPVPPATNMNGSSGPSTGISGMDMLVPPLMKRERNEKLAGSPFICRVRYSNSLPGVAVEPKLLPVTLPKRRFTKYQTTSLEVQYKHRLMPEPDLGIPIDILNYEAYESEDPPPPLDPRDATLLQDEEITSEEPQKRGNNVSWLIGTQYIAGEGGVVMGRGATLNRVTSLEKRAAATSDIAAVEATFEAAKKPPRHPTNPELKPVNIWPVLPDLQRDEVDWIRAEFDGDPFAGVIPEGAENKERMNIAKKMLLGDFHVQTVDKRFMAILIPKRKPKKTEVDELADEDDDTTIAKAGIEAEYEWVRALRYKMEKVAEVELTAETEEEEERQRFEEQLRYDNICLFVEDDRITYVNMSSRLKLMRPQVVDVETWEGPSRVIIKSSGSLAQDEGVDTMESKVTEGTVPGTSQIGGSSSQSLQGQMGEPHPSDTTDPE